MENDKNKRTQDETKFKPGNRFWEARTKHGIDKMFKTPKILKDAVIEYFVWVQDNPLPSAAVHDGKVIMVPKMQAMTMKGLCIFLGVNNRYFGQFKARVEEALLADPKGEVDQKKFKLNTEFATVITWVEDCIFTQKFTGAAAGLLNGNLISQELGMRGKIEVNHKNNGGKFEPVQNNVIIRMPHNNRPLVNMGKQADDSGPGTDQNQSQP